MIMLRWCCRSAFNFSGCGCKMNREDIDRIAASTCIIFLSGLVLFQSCHRASTIYFFELQTTTVIFIEPIPAILIPFALSGLLWLIYKGTKRSTMIELERKAIMDKAKEIEAASSPNSRKSSRNESRMESRKVSLVEDIQQAARLNRLLSDIQEQDTIHSQHGRRPSDASDTDQDRKPAGLSPKASTSESSGESSPSVMLSRSRFTCTKVEEPKLIFPGNDNAWRLQSQPAPRTMLRSRSSTESDYYRKFSGQRNPRERLYSLDSVSAPCTSGSMTLPDDLRGLSRKSSVSIGGGSVSRLYAGADDSDDDDSERERNAIYQQIGQTNFFTYSLSALNLLPKNRPGLPVLKLNFSDIWSEFFSVHLPIWACVVAFYIVLLELFGVHFAYYFYYHEEAMVYSALAFSIVFGLFHEFYGGWFTNDILAFSSIYIVCSRVQAVSYQAASILLVGMAIFDIFWLYVIDLISVITRESRAPLFITIPRDHHGNKQSLAALDIIVPGIFLNVIQKYSSMFDPGLFTATYAAVFGALTVTVIIAVYRRKIIPALALPALVAIIVSMGLCTHRNDLWRFMIKYKRAMPPKRV
uniref:Cyclic nucleotide-binding domain-containing protein n=1 Tax=Haemonchus contortus TaxID=6289 RepID=A0A7I4YKT9_HAECO